MLNWKAFCQSDRGFTLTEVMVGGALLAGIGLAGARLFKDQRQSQAKLDNEQILQEFHRNFTKFIQDEKNCNATFGAASWYNKTPTQIQAAASSITDFYTCSNCGATVGFNYDLSSATRNATPFLHLPAWIESVNSATGASSDQRGLWRIMSVDWKPGFTNPSGTGTWMLQVTYQMDPSFPGSRATKSMTVRKDVALNLRFTQNAAVGSRQLKECLSPKESSINNLQNDICQSMNMINSNGGMIMGWDDKEQKCVVQNAAVVKSCGPGMVVEGIRSDGSVHCEMLNQGVNPATDLSSPTACAPGSSVRLDYDPVTKKMKTACY